MHRQFMFILAMGLMGFSALWPQHSHAVSGNDLTPGSACTVEDAVSMTANPSGTGGYILTCEGGVWVATLNAALPTANEQVATKEYVDSAVAAGAIGSCSNNDTTLCALESSRSSNDPDFVPTNILSGVNILGVTGTASGGSGPFASCGGAPADCSSIGAVCTDGTVFVGCHPHPALSDQKLFLHPNNQSASEDWNQAGASTNSGINSSTATAAYDGRANQQWIEANRTVNATNFDAFHLCKQLNDASALGHTDWYLPSRVEMYYLWSVKSDVDAGPSANFMSATYWTSTESNSDRAWSQHLNGGNQDTNATKLANHDIRCLRRE